MSIKRLSFIILLLTAAVAAQAHTKITGIVLDKATQEPMIGATITISGTKDIAAVTDIDGRFTITVDDRQKITIAYIGYKTLVTEAHDGSMWPKPTVSRCASTIC